MEQHNKIAIFQEKQIRCIWHNEQWYFSVVDIVGVLSESSQPNRYWADMKKRSLKENNQPFAFCEQLKMVAGDGKERLTDTANTEGVLRIVMSIPSPKAEPFRLWLAQVGRERIEEIENPELGIERIRELYKAKGYSNEWIDTRLKSIDIRKQLTDEWKGRGVKEGQEYSILTAEIAKATFGVTPAEHKNLKGLSHQNLRDHMTNLELIFTMLGEESTRLFAVQDDAKGFNENHESAVKGGKAAGDARKNFEKSGQKVLSNDNFLKQIQDAQMKTTLPTDTSLETDETV